MSSGISIQYYSFFAYLLLKGDIIPEFKEFNKFFVEKVDCVLDETNLTPKVTRLLSNLSKFDIESKAQIIDLWKNVNGHFLLDRVLLWVDQVRFKKEIPNIKAKWTEMIQRLN